MTPMALILIDFQRGFDRDGRNNPALEGNVAQLLAAWRDRNWPIVMVRHDSADPDSPLHPSHPGNALTLDVDADLLVTKDVNSAFLGTPDLAAWLRSRHITSIAICGITTNHCCETTARMGGNLGFDVHFLLDATATFGREDIDGTVISADELQRVTGANLHGEFATVHRTADFLRALEKGHDE
ncbi:cysteine hydrolase [Corynebacterium sp. 13CS0277]|uniref:cysteine hydrolase family protein n=1 Tax=Corynebacterium sp. 13CS0277 TaxID=2071994 RepID=UPI000D025AFD|nr:cysteine hydrolase family protein [Corynebacterium sp. 13CS0277]PRQ11298.1 cysteine hydrolase [Corynebacterium sp. 13CS0277]